MSRSAAARQAEEVKAKIASLRPRRTRIGFCPVCDYLIYAHEQTAWRSVDGVTARIHDHCKDPS